MKRSRIMDYIFGYSHSEKVLGDSKIIGSTKVFGEKLISGVGRQYTRHLSKSPVAKAFSWLSGLFSSTTLRSYSLFFLSFGLFTLLLHFGESYFTELTGIVLFPLIVGAVCALLSIPLFIFDIPLGDALGRCRLTDYVFFEIFCLKRWQGEHDNVKINQPCATVLGIIVATLGFLFSLEIILPLVIITLFITLSLSSPEFCFMSTTLALPYIPLLPMPSLILALISALNLLSFFVKVLFGKRMYHLEVYDIYFLLFFLFILISGIFNSGLESFEYSLIFIALAGSYFLSSNLIVNRRLADNWVNLAMITSIPSAIYTIIDYYIGGTIHPEWSENAIMRAGGTFGNPNILSVFLIVILVFSFSHAFLERWSGGNWFYLFVFALNGYVSILTKTRGAWLALILAFIGLGILASRKLPKLLFIPLAIIPIALTFVPESVYERLLSAFNLHDSSVSSRLSIWRSSIRMFIDNIFTGVGIDEGSFKSSFLIYAEDGVSAPHSHNLFLEIGCKAGIFALILFAMLFIVRARHIASYTRYVRASSFNWITIASCAALFALVCFGMTDYILYNPAMCYLFFAVFGFTSALLRISKNEYDTSIGLTGGGIYTSENCALNIFIS